MCLETVKLGIDDILSFSRLEAGSLELEFIPFDLPTCLEDVVAMMSPAAHEKNLELMLHLHVNFPDQVIGDPTRLSQVLTNLISNAIKFTKQGHVFIEGTIAVGVKQPNLVTISISDTGEGMTEEEMKIVFQAFNQAESSITRRFGGAGLGLAISKRLAELMGGAIRLQSEKGKGASFTLQIPFEFSSLEDKTLDTRGLIGKNVLLFDGHPLSRRAIRSNLAGWGLQVFNTGDSQQLLNMLSASEVNDARYDLLIIGLDPKRFCSDSLNELFILVRDHFTGPVLLLVGSEIWQLPSEIENSPNVAWAAKPTRRKVLFQRITELLGLDQQTMVPVDATPHQDRLQPFDGRHILSVEDNEFNRKLLRDLLKKKGAIVEEAVSGEEAVKMASHEVFDLIFMDLHMPGMGGVEASQQIREQYDTALPPIIALSADVFAENGNGHRHKVFDEYLIKPISSAALDQVARNWLVGFPSIETEQSASVHHGTAYERIVEAGQEIPEKLQQELNVEIQRLKLSLKTALDISDWSATKDITHQLRGLVALYGMRELEHRLRRLEHAVDSEKPEISHHYFRQLSMLIDDLPRNNIP